MRTAARLLMTYLVIFVVFWLCLFALTAFGGVGSVELLILGAVAIGTGAYCTWKITRARPESFP